MKATIDNKGAMADSADYPPSTVLRAESRRLHVLWWRPPTDRKSVARLGGRVMKRTRPKSRSAAHQSCVAQRASRHSHSPFRFSVRGRADGVRNAVERGMLSQGPGEEACSTRRLPLSTTRVRLQREAAESSSMEEGKLRTVYPSTEPTSGPTVWRRGQRLDKVASGLAPLCAASDPSPGSSSTGDGRGDGEGRSRGLGAETEAQDQGSIFGPMTRPPRSHPMAT